ncbi:MAG: NAD(P)-dependent glycerol-3-phosphate dehydrogenase [Verrucomicrobiae bacterium]|nr:NAD(P)-dependent glycerol-3-phosphate dehydrogenase [Verrucomicrobiae bacterium]
MRISILGAGAWGTTLAKHLHSAGHAITLWDNDTRNLLSIPTTGRNAKYLPEIEIPRDIRIEPDLQKTVIACDVVVMAVPSFAFRRVSETLRDFDGIVVSVTKGIEYESGLTMSGILSSTAPKARCVALSGPTLALEVARGIPTAAVAASRNLTDAEQVQQLFHRPFFRVYTGNDILGVELGGALKNVVAIAAGVCDGLGFGDNSKAALVTRAVAEIRRLGVACGARAETFAGLSGIGDLVVTCFSKLSRNRTLGERLGRGEKLSDILTSTVTVAEGYPTSRAAHALARRLGVYTPIMDEVYAMLYENKRAEAALHDLVNREAKPEY